MNFGSTDDDTGNRIRLHFLCRLLGELFRMVNNQKVWCYAS